MKLWIARFEKGSLWLFSEKPIRIRNFYAINNTDKYPEPYTIRLNDDLFPEVTFENSPQEVELKLVK